MSHQLHKNKPRDSFRVKTTEPFLVSMTETGKRFFFKLLIFRQYGNGDVFWYLKGPTGKLEREFLQGHGVIGLGVMASNRKGGDLD